MKIGGDVRVTIDAGISSLPSLVWRGAELGLAWSDSRDGNREIYFARLDSAGNLVGGPRRVTFDTALSTDPRLEWTGSEYRIVSSG